VDGWVGSWRHPIEREWSSIGQLAASARYGLQSFDWLSVHPGTQSPSGECSRPKQSPAADRSLRSVTMSTMRALVAYERGGPDKLRMDVVPLPRPGLGEVLVEVHAAAITFAELSWPESWTHRPMIPSHDLSGVVASCGPGVTD